MNRIRFTLPALAAAFFVAPSPCQGPPLKPRSFFFDDYRGVICLDMKAMRDTGVWDEMSGSLVKLIGPMIEEEMGFTIDRLDKVTSVRAEHGPEDGERRFRQVTVVEGNGDLGTPRGIEMGRYTADEVGDHVLHGEEWSDDGMVMVAPELRVYGPADLLRTVLAGKPNIGLPSADVLAFTAAQRKVLLHFVADLRADEGPRESLQSALPDVTWPDDDRPTFACGRLRVIGDEDDPHVLFELVLRHGTAGEGLAVTEQAVDAAIAKVVGMKESRLFRPVLKKIERSREGTDAVWRVDLGRAREFGGLVGMLAPFMFVSRGVEVQAAQAAQVEIVEEVEEPPPPPEPDPKPKPKPKPKPGGGGGQGGGAR